MFFFFYRLTLPQSAIFPTRNLPKRNAKLKPIGIACKMCKERYRKKEYCSTHCISQSGRVVLESVCFAVDERLFVATGYRLRTGFTQACQIELLSDDQYYAAPFRLVSYVRVVANSCSDHTFRLSS